jgi:hypothetical protein
VFDGFDLQSIGCLAPLPAVARRKLNAWLPSQAFITSDYLRGLTEAFDDDRR